MRSLGVLVYGGLVPLLAVGGCQPAPQTPSPLALRVDSTAFHRRGQSPVEIAFGVTNRGNAALYLPQCNGQPVGVIDRWSLGAWRYFDGEYCNGGQSSLIAIQPGDSVQGLITVYEGGAYRLRVSAAPAGGGTGHEATAAREFNVW